MAALLWLHSLLVVILLHSAAACHDSCHCENGSMFCKGLDTFLNSTDISDNISSLVYEDCNFDGISGQLMYKNIAALSVHRSKLMHIADNVFVGMGGLKTLDLRNNFLSDLSLKSFSGLDSLQDLYLDNNQLTSLSEGVLSDLPSLVKIKLDGNSGFRFAVESFVNITSNLTSISCSHCNITDVSEVTKALKSVSMLRDLSLNGNDFGTLLDQVFKATPRLEVLQLNNCSINSISESAFDGLSQLLELNLGSNRIQNLPPAAFIELQKTLRKVFFNDNLLTTLDENLLSWSSLEKLQLQNNPWCCDCSLEWIRNFNMEIDQSNATCAQPEDVIGSNIASYPVNCSSSGNSSVVVLVIIISIVVICLALIGCFVFRCIRTLTRRRNARQKSSFRYSAVYKETVEPAFSKSRQPAPSKYQAKQDSKV